MRKNGFVSHRNMLNLYAYYKLRSLHFTFKSLLSKLFLPTPIQLREIHHYQLVDQKWGGGENDRYAKVKKGKVGGDEVGLRIQGDWRQTMSNGGECYCVCVCVGVVSVCVTEGEKRGEVLEVDPGSREPAGL